MKSLLFIVVFSCLVIFVTCQTTEDEIPPEPISIVSIGDSLTMGTQDAGIVIDSQHNNYPYLIAKQLGIQNEFQQPYVASPGIGVPPYERPLEISNNQIIAVEWPDNNEDGIPDVDPNVIISRLSNAFYLYPYNNLGVDGARLYDMRSTTKASDSQTGDNFFFDIVLRNDTPHPFIDFGGTTVVEQAKMLNPEVILLWIGSNDILHTVLDGCGIDGSGFIGDDPPTNPVDFDTEYNNLLTDLKTITDKIVMANIPSYLPYGYALDGVFVADDNFPSGRLMIFNTETFEPIQFDITGFGMRYIPLLLEEEDAEHLLLTGAIAFLEGMGIPNQSDLQTMGIDAAEASGMISAMAAAGITPPDPTSVLTGNFTVTQTEEDTVLNIIEQYNAIIFDLSIQHGIYLVDIVTSWWSDEISTPFGGYSGAYPIQDEANTAFSLDGVHPNNLGHALCANAFIKVLNQYYQLAIPELDPEDYKGQYYNKSIESSSIKAIKGIQQMYVPKKK
ncbi:MAG: hypothetical protein JSV25_07095 [Spirochaetota bacterium]|nr:MAG: hypothetical protein JSV25_07095 [Spirochaetota bacterium]